MKIHKIKNGRWPSGISDGLILPCKKCGKVPKFDYHVDDDFWRKVVDEEDRTWVICLGCLDWLATKKGLDVSKFLEKVQFTGKEKTIILTAKEVYYYEKTNVL